MIANFTPTPLYPRYQAQWNLSAFQVSFVFSAYAAGVLLVLVTLGGVSDRIGRLPALRSAAALILLSLAGLAAAPTYEALVAARFVQGLGTGIAASAGAAAIMELHPRGVQAGSFRFTLLISSGIALGPVLSGGVATVAPAPLVTPYIVVGTFTLAAAAVLVLAWLPPRHSRGHGVIRPIAVPRHLWLPFSAAAGAITTTNVAFGAVGSFGPKFAQEVGWNSPASGGALVSTMLIVVALTQLGGRRVPLGKGLVLACSSGSVGWLITVLAMKQSQPWSLLAGVVLIGFGAGLGLLSSSALVGAIAPADRRAELQAAYFAVAFVTVAATSLALAPVLRRFSLSTAALAATLADLVLTGVVAALVLARARPGGGKPPLNSAPRDSAQTARPA